MNKKEEFLTIFMREMLPILLNGVPLNQVDEMKAEYFNKIGNRYDKFILNSRTINLSAEELAKKIIIGEKIFFTNMTLEQKQQIYLKDESLDKLYDLSMTAYNMAVNFYKNKITISKNVLENLLSQMEDLVNKVENHNKGIATKLLSEGTIDLRYAIGETAATSFRFHDYIEDEKSQLENQQRDPK